MLANYSINFGGVSLDITVGDDLTVNGDVIDFKSNSLHQHLLNCIVRYQMHIF